MRGRGGGDGAIACSRQGEVEDDHDVHHSRMGAAQATLGLGALDEEQTFLDAAHGDNPRAKVGVDRPGTGKVARVIFRIRVEATKLHKICRRVDNYGQ